MRFQTSANPFRKAANAFLSAWRVLTRPYFSPDSTITLRRVQLFSSLLLVFIFASALGIVIGLLTGFDGNRQFISISIASMAVLMPLYFLSRSKWYSYVMAIALIFLFSLPFFAFAMRGDLSEQRIRSVLSWLVIVYLLGSALLSLRANIVLMLLSIVVTALLPVFIPGLDPRAVVPALGFLICAALFILAIVRFRDVAEADRADAIHEMQGTYRAVVENSLQGLVVYQNGLIVFANSAYASLLGYSMDELLALSPAQVEALIHPDDHLMVDQRTVASRVTPSGPMGIELRVLRKDGVLRWVEASNSVISYRGAPALQSAVVDITDRVRAARVQIAFYQIAEAAQSTQDLNAFYKAAHEIVCGLMPARNFYIVLYDSANDLFSLAYRQDELDREGEWTVYRPGRGLGAYILRTGKPLFVTPETFGQLESSGEVEILAHRMVDYLGVPLKTSRGIIGIMATQTYNLNERLTEDDRNVLALVSTQVAIAIERKQAQMEREQFVRDLEAKNAELEQFTYTVSHDLRSPIITIRGFLGYLEKAAISGNMDEFKRDISRIVNATDKMENLLNDLLELSRIGRIVNPPELIPFNEVVHEALALTSGRIQQSGAAVDVQAEMPTVYGDKVRLVEVLQNLLENAIKFCGDQPPRIEIGSTGVDGNLSTFFVRDHGIGIAPEYFERIFGLFNKLNSHSEGTGIGLALSKRIVDVQGGRISVESEGEGRGATFWVSLPAHA